MKWLAAIVMLCAAAVMLAGCGEMGFNNWDWHQRLTVEVDAGGKTVSGSSVTSILWWPNFFSGGWGGAPWHSKVEGEAVVVDLGEGRYLFALLSYSGNAEYIENLATRSLYDTTKRAWGRQEFRRVVNSKEPIIVPEKVYPLLVTFTDINDPKTVKKVDPRNLAVSFGPDYRLKSMTLEITNEEVTEGRVEQVLGWWCDLRKVGARLNGSTSIAISDNELSNNLGTGAFRVGDCS